MSFTDQKPRMATEAECNACWGGFNKGLHFRCYLCGHKFQVGDQWRWVYSNGKCFVDPATYKKWGLGNLIVCGKCDGTNDEVLDKWVKANIEARVRFWWLINETI